MTKIVEKRNFERLQEWILFGRNLIILGKRKPRLIQMIERMNRKKEVKEVIYTKTKIKKLY